MAVYIKGLQMPPNCWWCPVKFWNDVEYICPFSHKHINSGDADRHDDCPLVPVPDHGDLIDRDALMFETEERYCTGCDSYRGSRCRACWVDDMHGELVDAPVVIPAERSEDE